MLEKKFQEMPFLKNIGLVITYKCQVSCPHCIVEASPNRTEEMKLIDALNWIQQAANYRDGHIKILSLTGGEPFFNINKLKIISEYAASLGLVVSAVTNAFWATSFEEALSVLKSVRSVRMLTISTDVYHQQSIPFERVQNAVWAAKEQRIPFDIHICTEGQDDDAYKAIYEKALELTGPERINTAITFPAGRASAITKDIDHQILNGQQSACSAGNSPIILPDGRVVSCLGLLAKLTSNHPLYLGDLYKSSLEEILDKAETNIILHALRIWGPKKIISILIENGVIDDIPTDFSESSICNACYRFLLSDKIVSFLSDFMDNNDFKEKVAYGRLYYLRENKMVEMLNR